MATTDYDTMSKLTWWAVIGTAGCFITLFLANIIVQFQLNAMSDRLDERMNIYLIQLQSQNSDVENLRSQIEELRKAK